jgi:hypothetical protein
MLVATVQEEIRRTHTYRRIPEHEPLDSAGRITGALPRYLGDVVGR